MLAVDIRPLRADEVNRDDLMSLARQIRDYYKRSGTLIEIDVEKTRDSFLAFIQMGFAVVFILEDRGVIKGILGGFKSPEPLSGRMVANEVFWYVEQSCRHNGYGAALIDVFERWAIEEGCSRARLSHLVDLRAGENRRLYEGCGYKACEVYYEKGV